MATGSSARSSHAVATISRSLCIRGPSPNTRCTNPSLPSAPSRVSTSRVLSTKSLTIMSSNSTFLRGTTHRSAPYSRSGLAAFLTSLSGCSSVPARGHASVPLRQERSAKACVEGRRRLSLLYCRGQLRIEPESDIDLDSLLPVPSV